MSAPAVVVGLDCITGLQTARILADRGVAVIGIAADGTHFGARTNACTEVIESDLTGDGLIETLRRLRGRLVEPAVLIPCTDASVAVLSRRRGELADSFLLPLAPDEVVRLLADKASFARYAQTHGLPVPSTAVLARRADAEQAASALTFPCVLKPPAKSPAWDAQTSAKALPVGNAAELLAVYDQVRGWAPQIIAQEWIEGGEDRLYSCNCYFDEAGQVLVTFVARKLRQWPPGIGTSASGEECRDDEVLDITLKLFGSIGFHGLAYLELKRDARTGRLGIIEPNIGRPTGRSAIAEAGGVELVYTAYCDAAGLALPAPSAREQRYVGTKWLDLRRDVQAAVVARRRGDLTMRAWVRSLRGPKAHAIWSRRDPLPFVADMADVAGKGLRLLLRRTVAGRSSRGVRTPQRPQVVTQAGDAEASLERAP